MNRAQLVTDLKAIIGRSVDVDNSLLIGWINDAYMMMVDEIAKANPDIFVKTSITSVIANISEYELPSDFESIVMVNIKYNSSDWRRAYPMLNINQIPTASSTSDQGYTEGDPQYALLGDEIIFRPIPTETVNDGLKIWYNYTPTELTTDSQEPDIPAKYHYIIKYGAYANFLDRDDEHVAAERMRQRFDKKIEDIVETMSVRQFDQPKSIEIVTNSDLYLNNRDMMY